MTHTSSPPLNRAQAEKLPDGLGWFSIALGMTELFAPRALSRWLGMQGSESLLQAYGLREIGTGVAILVSQKRAGWVWGRVAGDSLDIATLASGLQQRGANKKNIGLALGAVVGVTILDALCAQSLSDDERPPRKYDYSRRSGFVRGPEAMRGAASDFDVPRDMRTPELLRPFTTR